MMSASVCWTMELRLGTGWPSDEKTLGEISLGDFNCHLPAITLQHKGFKICLITPSRTIFNSLSFVITVPNFFIIRNE